MEVEMVLKAVQSMLFWMFYFERFRFNHEPSYRYIAGTNYYVCGMDTKYDKHLVKKHLVKKHLVKNIWLKTSG